MGMSNASWEREMQQQQQAAAESIAAKSRNTKRANQVKKRLEVADKLVMVLTDRIVSDLIRPGPKPEERECYDMAQELRDMGPSLRELIVGVLNVEKPQTDDTDS